MSNKAPCPTLGYTHQREINGQWCGLYPFAFTIGLVVGINRFTYERRYCYEHLDDAAQALFEWDGTGHPGGPWIKCKGRFEGQPVDLLNPKINSFYPDGRYF